MSNAINIDGLEARVAILKPTVVGAAFRIFLLGGTKLTEKEAGQAAGSPYLLKENSAAIMGLVEDLEARTVTQAQV